MLSSFAEVVSNSDRQISMAVEITFVLLSAIATQGRLHLLAAISYRIVGLTLFRNPSVNLTCIGVPRKQVSMIDGSLLYAITACPAILYFQHPP